MNVLVDTSVWSLALRRDSQPISPPRAELAELIREQRLCIIGPIRQEVLSGVRTKEQFGMLREQLRAFPDIPLLAEDYEQAAAFYNLLRSKGIQGSNTDFLICAVAVRCGLSIYTTDRDFTHFRAHIPLHLHSPRHRAAL